MHWGVTEAGSNEWKVPGKSTWPPGMLAHAPYVLDAFLHAPFFWCTRVTMSDFADKPHLWCDFSHF
jgi:hypothetical protein